MKISVLTPQQPLSRGFNDFFPLIKWKKELLNEGFQIRFFSSHQDKKIANCDLLILDYRYFQFLINNKVYPDRGFIADFILQLKAQHVKVVLFDSADSTGSRCFDLTPLVDVHLKKQLLKDKQAYTINKGDKSTMCWLPETIADTGKSYTPCREQDLSKLKLSWHIGMVDYRKFWLSRYYPAGTSGLLNSVYTKPGISVPATNRPLFTSYRGGLKKDDRYSWQRGILIKKLKDLQHKYSIATGGNVSRAEFQKELRSSKVIVSPFGWGEICYRDFECFFSGALLLKPSVEHLETWPNLFIPNETYLPLKWDLSDLEQQLEIVHKNYEQYLPIAVNAQSLFIETVTNAGLFIRHFKEGLTT